MNSRPRVRTGSRTLTLATLLTLGMQSLPPVFDLLAGAGHSIHHLTLWAALAHEQMEDHRLLLQLPASGSAVQHTHGPDTEPHSHSAAVDLALSLVAPGSDALESGFSAPEQRLDRHLPGTGLRSIPPRPSRLPSPRFAAAAPDRTRLPPPLPPPRS